MCAADDDSESLCMEREHVDELTAKRASLTAGTEQSKAERENLAARTPELEVTAGTHDGDLRNLVRAVLSLKGHVAAGNNRANTAGSWARET